jgi:hypothetical protein
MNIPATSNSRSDDQIKADSEKDKGLEAGTMRDANGVPRNMRQFPPAPIETYAQYLARVSGLTDFTPLNEVQWRTETGQKTAEEMILADLGITTKAPGQVFCQKNMINFWQMPLVEVKVPLDTPVIDGTVETFPVVKELDIADYLCTREKQTSTANDVGKIEDLGIL